MRILAIVFPAVGTAVAAAIAFYTPQTTWSQSSRKWADLSQLHSQISLGVWDVDCKAPDYDKQLDTKIERWARNFADIQTFSSVGSPTMVNPGAQDQIKTQDKNQQEKSGEPPPPPPPLAPAAPPQRLGK